MKPKQELKNFLDCYGIQETLDALSDILIEQYQDLPKWRVVRNFLDDMCGEFCKEDE